MPMRYDYDMPDITDQDGFRQVVKKLALYVIERYGLCRAGANADHALLTDIWLMSSNCRVLSSN
jgi:hypothetical protein